MSVSRLADGAQVGPVLSGGPPRSGRDRRECRRRPPAEFPTTQAGVARLPHGQLEARETGQSGPVSQDGSLEPRPPALARLQGLRGAQKRPRASSPCASASTRERLGPVSGDVAAVALAVTAAVAVARLCSGATEAVAEKVGLGRRGRSG